MDLNFKTIPLLILTLFFCSSIGFSQTINSEKSDSNTTIINSDEKQDLMMPNSSNEASDINTSEFEIVNADGVKYIKKEDLPLSLPVINYPAEYYENRKESDNSSPE